MFAMLGFPTTYCDNLGLLEIVSEEFACGIHVCMHAVMFVFSWF